MYVCRLCSGQRCVGLVVTWLGSVLPALEDKEEQSSADVRPLGSGQHEASEDSSTDGMEVAGPAAAVVAMTQRCLKALGNQMQH